MKVLAYYSKKTAISSMLLLCLLVLNDHVFSRDSLKVTSIQKRNMPLNINVGLIVFPPFIRQETNDKCFGKAIDALHAIFNEPEYTLTIYCSSPSRIYRDFTNNKIDITYNIKSDSNLGDKAYYSDKPFSELKIVMYTHNLATKSNKSISAIRAYTYNGQRELLEQNGYQFVEHANTRSTLTFFLRGGTESIIIYQKPFEFYLKELGKNNRLDGLKTSFTQEELGTVNTYFVVNGRNEEALVLLNEINKRGLTSDDDY